MATLLVEVPAFQGQVHRIGGHSSARRVQRAAITSCPMNTVSRLATAAVLCLGMLTLGSAAASADVASRDSGWRPCVEPLVSISLNGLLNLGLDATADVDVAVDSALDAEIEAAVHAAADGAAEGDR